MRGALFLLLFALAACGGTGLDQTSTSVELRDWQLPTGKPPSSAEFAALMAACQDRVRSAGKGGSVDACLAGDYGMRRVQEGG